MSSPSAPGSSSQHHVGRVLTVAGSDPIGGAGLQADIKTITAMGGYAASAVTAITVQTTAAVLDIRPLAPKLVAEQMRAVLADIGADVIKSGMLGDGGIANALANVLEEEGAGIPYVLDPVLAASSGTRLLDDATILLIKTRLVPRAALVTPNIPEAEILTGLDIESGGPDVMAGMRRAAEALIDMGAAAVLITGGHMAGPELTDLLLTAEGETLFSAPRIPTTSTRGTGCTLASAIATGIAAGKPLAEAVEAARAFVRRAMEAAPGFGAGQGPLGHYAAGRD